MYSSMALLRYIITPRRFLACEAFAHGSVEAYAECAEERLVVGRSIVCIYNVAFGNHHEGAIASTGMPKVACESVA